MNAFVPASAAHSGHNSLRLTASLLSAPAVATLLVCSLVPLAITLWFSLTDYRLLTPRAGHFVALANYATILTSAGFVAALCRTLLLVGTVLLLTLAGGVPLALLLNAPVSGRGALRMLVISPFFVMPTVSALLWKDLLLHPVTGLLAWVASLFGLSAFDGFERVPLLCIALIIAWQWLPFATLILLTSLQSFNQELHEAAALDGASSWKVFRHLTLPHLGRPLAVVVMLETLFLLSSFAEIFVTTNGGPGTATTTLAFLIYSKTLLQFDVGGAAAVSIIAVLLANMVAFFLIRAVDRSLEI